MLLMVLLRHLVCFYITWPAWFWFVYVVQTPQFKMFSLVKFRKLVLAYIKKLTVFWLTIAIAIAKSYSGSCSYELVFTARYLSNFVSPFEAKAPFYIETRSSICNSD